MNMKILRRDDDDRYRLVNQLLLLCISVNVSILSGSYVLSVAASPVAPAVTPVAASAPVSHVHCDVWNVSLAAELYPKRRVVRNDSARCRFGKRRRRRARTRSSLDSTEGRRAQDLFQEFQETSSILDGVLAVVSNRSLHWCILACILFAAVVTTLGARSDILPIWMIRNRGKTDAQTAEDAFTEDEYWWGGWWPQECHVRQVWQANIHEEMAEFFQTAKNSDYVALDMEFPGFVYEAYMYGGRRKEATYKALRDNVNGLKPVQLGLSISVAGREETWQVNFKFDKECDRSSQASIEFLTSAGVDWGRHRDHGVCLDEFVELFRQFDTTSVHWISFHGLYDFGFLLRMLTTMLADERDDFLPAMNTLFPLRCDLKMLVRCGSLSTLGAWVGVERQGTAHQAGSDALLTLRIFHALYQDDSMKNLAFNNGHLFGLY